MMIRLTKMHGLGNDYLFLDSRDVECSAPEALAQEVADRNRGVGSDGLILVLAATGEADVRMRMFNADGSEAEMCGNGLRCLVKYVVDRGIASQNPLAIETGAGVLMATWFRGDKGNVNEVEVEMGSPILACSEIPAIIKGVQASEHVIGYPIDPAVFALPETVEPAMSLVSMGNPHVMIYGRDIQSVNLEDVGPKVEHDSMFPSRINLHLVEVHSPRHVSMRTWERGSGITQACGTGACAVVVAGVLGDRHERSVQVSLPGGDLAISWPSASAAVQMRGPAVEVFDVDWTRE